MGASGCPRGDVKEEHARRLFGTSRLPSQQHTAFASEEKESGIAHELSLFLLVWIYPFHLCKFIVESTS